MEREPRCPGHAAYLVQWVGIWSLTLDPLLVQECHGVCNRPAALQLGQWPKRGAHELLRESPVCFWYVCDVR